jgi:hypothetical protein
MYEVYRPTKGECVTERPPSVAELWKQPAPARAVVLGKGPSLSQFPVRDYHDWVIFAINEAVTARPGGMPVHVDYFMFVDSVVKTITNVPDGVIPIRGQGHHGNFGGAGFWFNVGHDLPSETGAGGTVAKTACVLGEWVKRQSTVPIEVLVVG